MNENRKPKPPTHTIFQVIGNDDKARWIRVGAGWANKDGKGLNLVFDSYPVIGRICLREVPPADTAEQTDLMAGAR